MKPQLIFILPLVAAFIFWGCPKGGGSGGDSDEVTVTFDSGIGSAVAPITVVTGAMIARPTNPTFTPAGAQTHFRGWYTDNGTFKQEFEFTTRVLEDITLYADYGYRAGDPGPAGGIVFYRRDSGFIVYELGLNSGPPTAAGGNFTQYPGATAYYLEAAPRDEVLSSWTGGKPFPATTFPPARYYSSRATGEAGIGWGKHNTDLIISPIQQGGEDYECPPAKACRGATYGDKNDWFLPCVNELEALAQVREVFPPYPEPGSLITASAQGDTLYWTSSRISFEFVWAVNLRTRNAGQDMGGGLHNARAIRAF